MGNKVNQIRKCPNCGVTETINTIKMKTIKNERVKCLEVSCDECGYIFDIIPQKG